MKNYLQLVSGGEVMSFNNQMNKRLIKTPEEIGRIYGWNNPFEL